jgi:tetratricopeptide (TPR) repeat protein
MKKTHRIAVPALAGLITAALYILTAGQSIDPVVSARTVAEHLGLTPFPPLSHPLWELLIRSAVALSPFSIGATLNTLNALICGAISALLSHGMLLWNWNSAPEKYRYPPNLRTAAWISALLAPATFTLLLPVWVAGTRTTALPFDVLLLMLLVLFLRHIFFAPTPVKTLLFLLLWGVGMTEYSSCILLTPFALLAVLVILWKMNRIRPGMISLCAVALLTGLGVYVLMALRYYHCPAYQWREFRGFHQIFWYLLRSQHLDLRASTMTIGWLLIVAFLLVPWLLQLAMPLMDQRRIHYRPTSYLLFLVLAVIAAFVLLNLPPAPWFITKLHSLLLLPYVFFAAWFARLTGTFYLTLAAPEMRRNLPARLKRPLRFLPPVAAIVLLAAAAMQNVPQVDTRPLRQVDHLARQIVSRLDGRNKLLTTGLLDSSIALAAHEQQVDLAILNLPLGISKSYRRYVSSLFDDPRLQNLATIGWDSLLQEWSTRDPDFYRKVAVMQPPEIWSRLGFTAAPLPLAYFGEKTGRDIAADQLENAADFWQENLDEWQRVASYEKALGLPWYNVCRLLASQQNNNLGILLEDQEMPQRAAQAYQRAISLETNNVSALMNLLALQKRLELPAADQTEQQLETMLANQRDQLSLWQLSSRYGYIRNPNAYMAQGYVWAISGKPAAAIHEVRRAMEMTGETPDIKMLLADLYVQARETEAGQRTYQEILEANPEDEQALYGLARIAANRGDLQVAEQHLDQLQQLGIDPESRQLQGLMISIAVQDPDYSRSRKLLRDMIKKDPENPRLWATLAYLASTHDDIETATQARDVLQEHVQRNPVYAIVLAQIESLQGAYENAANYLNTAISHLPANIPIREQYLEILVNLRRREEAEEQAATILGQDPSNALANYITGTIQASRAEHALAENSYRASLETRRNPLVLNDLAWLLAKKGDYAQALPYVQESLELLPNNPNALDTLGYIQLGLGNTDQAETLLRQALSYQPNSPAILLHLALTLEAQGKKSQALQVAEPLLNRMHELSADDYADARQLVTRLR